MCICRETIARVTGGMKVKADRDEVGSCACICYAAVIVLHQSRVPADNTSCVCEVANGFVYSVNAT